jgi:hypothetical protein
VRQVVPRSQYKIPLPPAYGPPVGSVPDPPRTDLVKYGEYLAGPVAHCMECHTPFLPEGRPDTTRGEIIASIYGARRGGGRVLPPMPTQHYAQGIPEGDLRAIVAYLRSLPPIRNQVPPPEPPKKP